MFQFAFEAVLFRLTYETPQFAPLFELPPRIGTRGAPHIPIYLSGRRFSLLLRYACNSPSQESGLQDTAAPMPQVAVEAGLFRLTDETPQYAPLPEEPPRIGTRVPLLLK